MSINDLAENLLIKGQCAILDVAYKIMDHDIVANRDPAIKRYSIIGAESNIYRYIDQPDGLCDRRGPGGASLFISSYTRCNQL